MYLFVCVWTFYFCEKALAQPTLRAEVVPETGSLEDLFLFTVTADGVQERVNPQLSTSADFNVQLLGPKTSVSIVNGVVRSQQAFIYQLSPRRAGTIKTPEVQAVVSGQQLSAPPISVVIRGTPTAAEPSGDQTKDPIFMNQTVSPASVYIGQQTVNSVTLYTQYSLQGLKIEDDPADGFWQEEISNGNNTRKNLNGQEYVAVEMSRALFPLRAGPLRVPSRRAVARIHVRKQTNPLSGLDPFGDDFFENFFQRTITKDKSVTSQELTVDVKPLPSAPAEVAKFLHGIPIVGATSLAVHYSDAAIKVGESKNISLIITSEGNLNPIKSLPLNAPAGVKLYDGQAQVKHDARGARLITQKTFSFSAVPLEPGVVRIPGASLAYFDPEARAYKLTTTPDITMVVTGSPLSNPPIVETPGAPSLSNPPLQQGGNPSLIPTPLPIPVAPPLSYTEPSLLDTISERVSVQLALLIASATIALVCISVLIMRAASAAAPTRSILSQIAKASSLADLEQSLRAWAIRSIPGASSQATFDELRALVRSRKDEQSVNLSLLSLLDEVELGRYSSQSQAVDIADLKRRFTLVVKAFR